MPGEAPPSTNQSGAQVASTPIETPIVNKSTLVANELSNSADKIVQRASDFVKAYEKSKKRKYFDSQIAADAILFYLQRGMGADDGMQHTKGEKEIIKNAERLAREFVEKEDLSPCGIGIIQENPDGEGFIFTLSDPRDDRPETLKGMLVDPYDPSNKNRLAKPDRWRVLTDKKTYYVVDNDPPSEEDGIIKSAQQIVLIPNYEKFTIRSTNERLEVFGPEGTVTGSNLISPDKDPIHELSGQKWATIPLNL